MGNTFKVSYQTSLPKEGNAPRVTITGREPQTYRVRFSEVIDNFSTVKLVSEGYCKNNMTIIARVKQWFTIWVIDVFDESGKNVFSDMFDPQGEVVFIKMDAYALGDSIAWIPYVEEFRDKHKCKVICSTFHNELFIENYPEIMFVKPNTVIDNIYAQYYIGASNDGNVVYSPILVNKNPLQDVASSILGLEREELRPNLIKKYAHTYPRMKDKYVTLSEYGSGDNKSWKAENGWQSVVNYLVGKEYKVLVISKEKTNLTNIIDLTGNINIDERAIDIMHAEFHLGVSSGLSWLAWAMGTHTLMISDVTPIWHEFQSNVTRLNSSVLEEVNYLVDSQTSVATVLEKLGELIVP
jgi:autotransporter strand-loop-strand O-heptosyltransferase